jgi:hypothetical protein
MPNPITKSTRSLNVSGPEEKEAARQTTVMSFDYTDQFKSEPKLKECSTSMAKPLPSDCGHAQLTDLDQQEFDASVSYEVELEFEPILIIDQTHINTNHAMDQNLPIAVATSLDDKPKYSQS